MKDTTAPAASRTSPVQTRRRVTRKLVIALSVGALSLATSALLLATDPMLAIARYKFRLSEGSILHELLQSEIEGGRFAVYLFNITNAGQFLAGLDARLKLQEVGPFTYVEYRRHERLRLVSSGRRVRFTPRMRSVFVPEQSVADPARLRVTMPNIPMLSSASVMSGSPVLIRSMYSALMRQLGSNAVVTVSAAEYLWGYRDPVLTAAHALAPGLIHFNTTGIMDRLYDRNVAYQMELGATDEDKFSIKTIKKYKRITDTYSEPESVTTLEDTYEGMAYPPGVTARTPISIYRVGICSPFEMQLSGRTASHYGPNAFVYRFKERMFDNERLCDSKGWCPKGVMDMSKCFYGLPLGLSKGHFLDADPKVFERIEGLKPDPVKHDSHMVIEPKIGLTLETAFSLQVNVLVGDIAYCGDAERLSDMLLPVAHFRIRQPRLPDTAVRALRITYITVPLALHLVELALVGVGAVLLLYAGSLHWRARRRRLASPPATPLLTEH